MARGITALAAALGAGALVAAGSLPPAHTQGLRQIVAQDRSFVVQIPPDWSVAAAVMQNFTARGPRGEQVTVGTDDVLADAQSLDNARTICRQYGASCQYRYWASPLAPMDVVRVLFPQYSPSMGGVRVLGVWPVNVAGFRGGLVWYAFVTQGAANEGFAEVFVLPGLAAPQLRYWNFVAATATGPRQVFRRNLALYAAILESFRYSSQALRQVAQAPLKLGEDLRAIDREFGSKWWGPLGGQARYPCPDCAGGQGTKPWDELPPDRANYDFYTCGTALVSVPRGTGAPGPGCRGPVSVS